MRRSRTRWVALPMGVVSVGLSVAAVGLAARNGEGPGELVANHHAIGIVTGIGMAVLGALIADRKPGNPIGWLMSLSGLLLGVFSFNQQYGAAGRGRVAAAGRAVELAGHLDRPARGRHHHHQLPPAVPGRAAAVTPLAAA